MQWHKVISEIVDTELCNGRYSMTSNELMEDVQVRIHVYFELLESRI